jgi:hypothetical protein
MGYICARIAATIFASFACISKCRFAALAQLTFNSSSKIKTLHSHGFDPRRTSPVRGGSAVQARLLIPLAIPPSILLHADEELDETTRLAAAQNLRRFAKLICRAPTPQTGEWHKGTAKTHGQASRYHRRSNGDVQIPLKNRLLRQPLCGGKSPRESRYPHQMQSSNARFRSNRFEGEGKGM